jgi:DNA-binding MltR family transcriptional regulator
MGKKKGWQPLSLDELSEDSQKVYGVLNEESDLACVLIGTSFLAELLATTLKEHFIASTIVEKLLDPQRGTVGGFATRADLAYCLGLVSKPIYSDLIRVAEIRNQFAHRHLALDFSNDDVRQACEELHAWRALLHGQEEERDEKETAEQLRARARNQFNLTVVLIGSRIHVDAFSRQHRKAQAGKEQVADT